MRRDVLDRGLVIVRRLPKGKLREFLENALRGLPVGHRVGCRADRLNRVAVQIENAKDYLEIGVQYGFTLSSVSVENKTGVDPRLMFNRHLAPGVKLHKVTSDKFFARLKSDIKFDLIFLDGLHTFGQTSRDFVNALKHLRQGGAIVIDDVVPTSWEKALPDREESIRLQILSSGEADGEWFGDVWKLVVAVHELFGDFLEIKTYGYGACGQSVIHNRTDSDVIPNIGEEDFLPFRDLDYSDYFPSEGTVLLPGYSRA